MPRSHHELMHHYQQQYDAQIASGEFDPFIYPYGAYGAFLVIIYLCVSHQLRPWLKKCRFLVWRTCQKFLHYVQSIQLLPDVPFSTGTKTFLACKEKSHTQCSFVSFTLCLILLYCEARQSWNLFTVPSLVLLPSVQDLAVSRFLRLRSHKYLEAFWQNKPSWLVNMSRYTQLKAWDSMESLAKTARDTRGLTLTHVHRFQESVLRRSTAPGTTHVIVQQLTCLATIAAP